MSGGVPPNTVINNRYRVVRKIGAGSFGEIYVGVSPTSDKVALKFERQDARCPQLRHEYKVYRELHGCHGFARMYYFGDQDSYNVMVMELLGPSLEDVFNRCNRRFSLKTVLQIADQLLERIDTLHSRHLIHRDVKPANFVVGTGDHSHLLYCVDFGLSKRYRHPKTHQHIPHRDGRSLTGTPRYASINNHLGIEQSRRDDLESIGYVLIYFLKGSLPWQGLKAKSASRKYRMILEKKQSVSIAQLCAGCPSQFSEFLAYCRALKFDTKPDIPYLRKLFRDLYYAQGYASDTSGKVWDWDRLESPEMPLGIDSRGTEEFKEREVKMLEAPPAAQPTARNRYRGDERKQEENLPQNGTTDPRWKSSSGPGLASSRPVGKSSATRDSPASGRRSDLNASNYRSSSQWGFHMPTKPPTQSSQAARPSSSYLPGDAPLASPGHRDRAYESRRAMTSPSDEGQRRPQTAQNARQKPPAPFARTASSNTAPANGQNHMVAGARAMMRYRRSNTHGESAPAYGPTTTVGATPKKSAFGWTVGSTRPRTNGVNSAPTAPTAASSAKQTTRATAASKARMSTSRIFSLSGR